MTGPQTQRVALLALGPRADELTTSLGEGVTRQLGCPTVPVQVAMDVERFYDSRRGQYWSSPMLTELDALRPPEATRILAMTRLDLFVPVLTFVFGEAHLGGTAAVVSGHRLDPIAYGLAADPGRLAQRALKEAVHELGHTFGLVHCRDYACVMRASRAVDEVDAKVAGFCPSCAQCLASHGLDPARRPA